MGKWKRQPSFIPGQLPAEIREGERERVEQEIAAEMAREEALIEQEMSISPPVMPASGVITPLPVPEPVPTPPYECPTKPFLYIVGIKWDVIELNYCSAINIVDLEEGVLAKTVLLDSPLALFLTYDPVYQRIYVTGGEVISVFDVETDAIIATFDMERITGLGVGIDLIRNRLYVPLRSDPIENLVIIDLDTLQIFVY